MHIGEQTTEQSAKHLKSALQYIQNAVKTASGVLVGSVNCRPETAFEQMMDTKRLFGKEGRRMAYHFVISLVPGEGTPEMAFEIAKQFVEKYLGGQYEVVYSVHTDRDHIHCHILFNSVRMIDGYKYSYKKGDWKRVIQPITNKLCEEYQLEIMPAEYAVNPVNLSRKDWEHEQTFKPLIKEDVKFCVYQASSFHHFIYLMEQLGYEVKQGKHIAVKTSDMKQFKRLDTLSPNFTKERLEYEILYGKTYADPLILTDNPSYSMNKNHSGLQKQFYCKMFNLRVIERDRFTKHAATKYEDLKRFHELQNEYLFLCRKSIKDPGDIIDFVNKTQDEIKDISRQQHLIYARIKREKDICKTEDDWIAFNASIMDYHDILDALKLDKKSLKTDIKYAKKCFYEELKRYSISNDVQEQMENEDIGILAMLEPEIPEDPEEIRKKMEEQLRKEKTEAERKAFEQMREMLEKLNNCVNVQNQRADKIIDGIDKYQSQISSTDKNNIYSNELVDEVLEEDTVEIAAASEGIDSFSSMEMVIENTINEAERVDIDSSDVVLEETDIVEKTVLDAKMESGIKEVDYKDSEPVEVQRPATKEEYLSLTHEERAVRLHMDMNDRYKYYMEFNRYLTSVGINYTFGEMIEKADEVAEAGKRMTKQKQASDGVEIIYDAFVDGRGRELFTRMNNREKAEKMNLDVTDYSAGIRIYNKLINRLGVKRSQHEVYDEFQEIFKETVNIEESRGNDWSKKHNVEKKR